MILRGELAPGARVQERTLCEQLGISRTPLREALKVLASRGLVELRVNRGARVAPLRAVEVADAFEVLSLLERRAGESVAQRLTDDLLRHLLRLHQRIIDYGQRSGGEVLLRADLRFHRAIVEAAPNRELAEIHETLAVKVERARYLAAISPERMRHALEEHEKIMEALLARDAVRIGKALYEHCLMTRDAVVAAVTERLAEEDAAEAA